LVQHRPDRARHFVWRARSPRVCAACASTSMQPGSFMRALPASPPNDAIAPMISSRRMSLPIFEFFQELVCRRWNVEAERPSQAAKSRERLKTSIGGRRSRSHAVIGPIPASLANVGSSSRAASTAVAFRVRRSFPTDSQFGRNRSAQFDHEQCSEVPGSSTPQKGPGVGLT